MQEWVMGNGPAVSWAYIVVIYAYIGVWIVAVRTPEFWTSELNQTTIGER